MKNNSNGSYWSEFIELFYNRYRGRPTRLGVFEPDNDITNDYWIESGLPLTGLDLDTHGGLPVLRVTVGEFSHEVANALKVTFTLSASGEEDGIDILDGNGRTTVLRIEEAFPPNAS